MHVTKVENIVKSDFSCALVSKYIQLMKTFLKKFTLEILSGTLWLSRVACVC